MLDGTGRYDTARTCEAMRKVLRYAPGMGHEGIMVRRQRVKTVKARWVALGIAMILAMPVLAQPLKLSRQPVLRSPALNAQYHRAEAAWESGGSLLEAKTRLDRVLQALPDDQAARRLRARVLLALGRVDEALVDARRAVELDPEDGEAYDVLCEAARRSGDLELAERALDEATRRTFSDPNLLLRFSWHAVELERLDDAASFARRALVQAPGDPAAYYQVARVALLQGQPDDAVAVLVRGFRAGLLQPEVLRADSLLSRLASAPPLVSWMK